MTAPVDEFSAAYSTAFDPPTGPAPNPAANNGLMLDERVHTAAITAILGPVLNGHVYDYGEIPGEHGNQGVLPRIFAVISVERRPFGGLTRAGRPGNAGWRLIIRSVGTTVDEARWATNQASMAIDGVRLLIDDELTTPVTFEVEDPVRVDEDRFSGSTTWVYAVH